MQLDQFNFILPEELIAQHPLEKRSASRLLCLSTAGHIAHRQFQDLPSLLRPHDLLVFNNTKVIKARLFGEKITGGKVEILVERIINDQQVLAQVRASKSIKIGMEIILQGIGKAVVIAKQREFFLLQFFAAMSILSILQKYGHVPLPPYIIRFDDNLDEERYQSIFAKRDGAVAAPTASLHFDNDIIAKLQEKNIDMAFVTLHVGAGTFQPVRIQEITQHKMHAEYMEITPEVCAKIKTTKGRGGRVIAVGTTCVRCLETAAKHGTIEPFIGDTDIFIYPGFTFRCVDALITNFHLPKSTLLMLVCAFAGFDNVVHAYQEAIKMRYRFFSYGDAMFIIND